MSDILIKGMEMPSCGLTVTIYPDGRVVQFFGYGEKKQLGTAVPVPPHGRLIDADDVALQIDEWMDSVGTVMIGHGMSYYGELLGCIEDAPTIIPASKEDV